MASSEPPPPPPSEVDEAWEREAMRKVLDPYERIARRSLWAVRIHSMAFGVTGIAIIVLQPDLFDRASPVNLAGSAAMIAGFLGGVYYMLSGRSRGREWGNFVTLGLAGATVFFLDHAVRGWADPVRGWGFAAFAAYMGVSAALLFREYRR